MFRFVGDPPKDDAGEWHMAPCFMGQCDPFACGDHVHQRVPSNVAPLETRRSPMLNHTPDDMLKDLRPGATLPNKEILRRKVSPSKGFLGRNRMRGRKSDHQRLVPEVSAMAIRYIGDIDDKGHIELAVAYHGESM